MQKYLEIAFCFLEGKKKNVETDVRKYFFHLNIIDIYQQAEKL